MRITDITTTKRGNYALHVDGEFLLSLHPDIFLPAHLKIGEEVGVEQLEALRQESELRIAKDRALRLLSARSYTGAMLQEKLQRYADPDAAQAAVARMEELGLIDDADYACRLARDLKNLKHYSISRIRQELRRRGIADWMVDEALEQFEEGEEQEALTAFITRRYSSHLTTQKGRTRVTNALIRLGYGFDSIRSALAQVVEEEGILLEEPDE